MASGPAMNGEVHGTGIDPSTEQKKSTFCWSARKVNVALARPLTRGGPEVMIVSGSPTTVQV